MLKFRRKSLDYFPLFIDYMFPFQRSISKVIISPHYQQRIESFPPSILNPLLDHITKFTNLPWSSKFASQGVIYLRYQDFPQHQLYRQYCQAESPTQQTKLLTARPVKIMANLPTGHQLIGALTTDRFRTTVIYLLGIYQPDNDTYVCRDIPSHPTLTQSRPIKNYQSIFTPQSVLTPVLNHR